MKIFKYALLAIPFLYFSCSDDDDNDNVPEPINEEEVITTMTVTLTPESGDVVVLQTRDLDGEDGEDPDVNVSGPLQTGMFYYGSIQWLNEMEDEPEDITLEIIEEADEHQVFFDVSDGLDMIITYTDVDSNDYPVGTQFGLHSGPAGSGSLTITLIHEPDKPNDGTVESAGGSIDIQTSFDIVVE